MADAAKLAFAPFATPAKGVLVLFCEEGLKFGAASRKALEPTGDLVQRAAAADRFTGKSGSSLDLLAPAGLGVGRLSILGVGKAAKLKAHDFVKLGGSAMGKVPSSAGEATIFADLAGGAMKPDQAAELALGTQLRAYVFDR
jgi:leucyl aminopeptidase